MYIHYLQLVETMAIIIKQLRGPEQEWGQEQEWCPCNAKNIYQCIGGAIQDLEQARLTLPLVKTLMLYFEKYEHCYLEQSVSLIRHARYGCVYGTPVIHSIHYH